MLLLDPLHPELLPDMLPDEGRAENEVGQAGDVDETHAGGQEEDVVPQPPARFQCVNCEFFSRTNAGLQAHRRRSHNQHSDLSLRVSTTSCEACSLPFGKRWRVLDHLRNSKRCASYIMEHVQPLSGPITEVL
eukprot:3624746-Amphidinium_carterae.1